MYVNHSFQILVLISRVMTVSIDSAALKKLCLINSH